MSENGSAMRENASEASESSHLNAVIHTESEQPVTLHQTQEMFEESESSYQRLIARMSAIVFELAPDGTILKVNDSVERYTGYQPGELEGNNWWDIFCPEDYRAQVNDLNKRFETGDVASYELTMVSKSGNPIIVELNSANDYSASNQLEKIVGIGIDITKRIQAEQQVKHGEQLLVEAQRLARLGSWFWDIPSGVVTWSEELYHIFGISPQEFGHTFESFLSLVHPDDRKAVGRAIQASKKKSSSFKIDHRILRPDGSEIFVLTQGEFVAKEKNEPVRMLGTTQDITERKQAEETLFQSEERFRLSIEGVKDYAIFTLDPEGRVTSWNAGAEAIKGYTAAEIMGEHFSRFYTPEQKAVNLPARALEIASREGRFEHEGWRVRKNGSKFWASVIITALRDDSGRLVGFSKVVRDITRRKEAEDGLKRQSEVIRLLQEVAVAANEAASVEAAMQFVLDRLCAYTGWNLGHAYILAPDGKGELVSTGIWHMDKPGSYEDFRKASQDMRFPPGTGLPGRVLANGAPEWFTDLTGNPHYHRTEYSEDSGLKTGMAFPVLTGKKVVGVLEFFTDQSVIPAPSFLELMTHIGAQLGRVLERQQAEENIRQSEARFRSIFEGAPLGIELIDLDGHLLESNAAVSTMLGYSAEELRQITRSEEKNPANLLANVEPFNELRTGNLDSFGMEKPYIRKDGRLAWSRLVVSLVRDLNQKAQFVIAMMDDITERKQMEAELVELQRRLMESREAERLHLAQELHDGPVQDLLGLSFNMKAVESDLPEENRQSMEVLRGSLQKVISTIRTICREMRPPTLAPFGLEKAIRSHVDTFTAEHPDIHVHLELMADGKMLKERVRLALFRIYQQMLVNVVRHAHASNILVRFKYDQEQATLEIQDDGEGFVVPGRWIEMARKGHLGLVGAAERAEAIGGKMKIESSPGEGTTVRVTVPIE